MKIKCKYPYQQKIYLEINNYLTCHKKIQLEDLFKTFDILQRLKSKQDITGRTVPIFFYRPSLRTHRI
jgi:hypothetical protein